MDEKRILLIESGRFIGGVIHNLFKDYTHLEVLEAAPASRRELLKLISDYQPEIVVMDDTVRIDYLAYLLRNMKNSRCMRVIVVNTESNQVEVYQMRQVKVSQSEDFFAILHSGA